LHQYYVTAVYDGGESDATNTVEVLLTGVQEQMQNSLKLYPNPASDFVNIMLAYRMPTITVYDYTGNIVMEEQVNNTSFRVNTSQFSPGVYLFRIIADEGMVVKQVVSE